MELETLNINKICRACEGISTQMLSLFNRHEDPLNTRLDKMLMACASIQVSYGDGLPAQICQTCLKHLKIAFTFKQRCEKSDANLRKYASNVSAKEMKQELQNSDFVDTGDTIYTYDICDREVNREDTLGVHKKWHEPQPKSPTVNNTDNIKIYFFACEKDSSTPSDIEIHINNVENSEKEQTEKLSDDKMSNEESNVDETVLLSGDINHNEFDDDFKKALKSLENEALELDIKDEVESDSEGEHVLKQDDIQSDDAANDNISSKNTATDCISALNPLPCENIENIPNEKKKLITFCRTPSMCYFCKADVYNFARHILRHHSGEIEVQKILALPPGDSKRKRLISVLRKKGNHLKNINNCFKPVKRSRLVNGEDDNCKYVPCKHCLGYYRARHLYRHVKKCPENNGQKTAYSHLTDAQNVLTRHLFVDPQLREKVFPRMLGDKISLIAKKDLLIRKFGTRYLNSHRDGNLVTVCSRKMRELARLLIEIKKLRPSIRDLYDALQPRYFNLIVEATKIVAKYDPSMKQFRTPTYAANIHMSLKQCCDIAMIFILKRKRFNSTTLTAKAESNVRSFKQLLQTAWRLQITPLATKEVNLKESDKITILSLATDLKKFLEYLSDKANQSLEVLKNDKTNEKAYRLLMESVFCRLVLLNRKRFGELEQMSLSVYQNARVCDNCEEFSDGISLTEKILFTKFKKVVIRRRDIPVLFSADLQQHVEVLLVLRSNFVQESNTYLFPKLNTNNPIIGFKIMHIHSTKSDLKNPLAVTSARLRNLLATLTQIFSMNPGDIEQLTTLMGHTNDSQKQVYLPHDVTQTVKIFKLLALREQGKACQFKGKSLDEINFNLEDEILFKEDVINEKEPVKNVKEPVTNEKEPVKNEKEPVKNQKEPVRNEKEPVKNVKEPVKNEKERKVEEIKTPPSLPVSSNPLKKTRILIPWTDEQKFVAQTFFRNHIKQKKPPKKGDCEELKEKHPGVFENKTWPQIKVFIQNIYSKR